jgi:putative ABC transport system permease protein
MSNLIFSVMTQSLTFLPLSLAISISYSILRATDMTLDGSFVLGAGVFARLITQGCSPPLAGIIALFSGASCGMMVSLIQRGGKVDPLLAGILAYFILVSANLAVMGKPNINLLSQTTLLSSAFSISELTGWSVVACYSIAICIVTCLAINSRFGLILRGLGDNPALLQRLGKNIETYRLAGFAFTNLLSAASGCLTAQTVGYADIGMGFGMTLTGIGAIILGQQILRFFIKKSAPRIVFEFTACLIGVFIYFLAINGLLRLDINPVYLKMVLGMILILFLRTAVNPNLSRNVT